VLELLLTYQLIYFTWPETSGRTLEELNQLFKSGNVMKESRKKRTMADVAKTIGKEGSIENIEGSV
jgi:hypothetical protein